MTLTELRYFVVLSQELNFIRAARKLFITQPSLTLAMKKLEDDCGGKLFERNKTGLKITDLGQKVLVQAKIILQDILHLEDIVKQNNDIYKEPLKIGAIHTSGPYLFPLILPVVKSKMGVSMHIYEDFTHNLGDKLANGELDAIIVVNDFVGRQCVSFELFNEEFYVLIYANHSLNGRDKVTFNDIKYDNLIVLGEGHCFRDNVLQACPYELATNSKNIISSSLETIRNMVGVEMGISIIPYLATKVQSQNTKVIPLIDPKISRDMVLVCRASSNKFGLIRELSKLINQIYKSV